MEHIKKLTIPIDVPFDRAELEEYIADLHRAGAQRVFLGECEFFCEGKKREERLNYLKYCLDRLREEGFENGIWTTTLGYGNDPGPEFQEKFANAERITAFDGKTTHAVCVLDEPYKAYIQRNMRDFAALKPDIILLDDELVLSARPGVTCSCPAHLRAFERRTHRTWTREQVRDLLTGKPTEHRRMWMDLTGETMVEYCRELRQAVDAVDPEVRIGLCASYSDFDLDGMNIRDCVRVLAGEKHMPLLRLSGATYWANTSGRMEDQKLFAVMEFLRAQAGWLHDDEIELMDENDCYPRQHDMVPASWVELYDKVILASGDVGRMKYIMRKIHEFFDLEKNKIDPAYLREHLRNQTADEQLTEMFAGTTPVGFRVYETEQKIREAELPEPYAGDHFIQSQYSQPRAGVFLTANTIPTCYYGAGAGIAFGENTRALSAEVLKNGLLTDFHGARVLIGRGIDVGVIDYRKRIPEYELFSDRKMLNREPEAVCYQVQLSEKAEVLSWFEADGERYPSCWYYENAQGQRFAVLAFDGDEVRYSKIRHRYTQLISPQRARQAADIYRRFTGKALPAYIEDAPELQLIAAKRANGGMALLLANGYPDWVDPAVIQLDDDYEIESTVRCDGTITGRTLNLGRILPFEFAAVSLRKKK